MTIIGLLALAFRRWAQERARRSIRRQARARLAMLDPHMLRDIGLDRETVEDEVRQPAAQPLGLVLGEVHIAKRPIDLGPRLTDGDVGDWVASGPVPKSRRTTGRLPAGLSIATTVKDE